MTSPDDVKQNGPQTGNATGDMMERGIAKKSASGLRPADAPPISSHTTDTQAASARAADVQANGARVAEAHPASAAGGSGGLIVRDAVIIAIAFFISFMIRFKSGLIGFTEGSEGYLDLDYWLFLPCGVALWVLAIYVVRGYEADVRGWNGAALTRLAVGSVLALLLLGVGDALARASMPEWFGISRKFLLLAMVVGFVALVASRQMAAGKK